MVNMEQVIPIRKIEETIQTMVESFYNEYKLNSENTATAYKNDVLKFIEVSAPYGLNTALTQAKDFINYDKVSEFRNQERKRGLASTTINRRVTAIREFSKHLKFRGIELDISFFEGIKPLKGEADSYEVISTMEAMQIAEWLRENEKFKSEMKYYYVMLAVDTGIRADALSKLTPKNFIELDDFVLIKGIDKGKKRFSKRISKESYLEMKNNLKEWTALSQPIFSITEKNRADMMKRALKGLGWEDRNITFHSFKKAAVNGAFEATGDIRIAMKVGSHSSVATTQRYLSEEGDDFLGAISNGNLKKIKSLDYNDFTKEELIEAVSNMSQNFQYQLKSELVNNSVD